jgi:transposase
MIQVQEWERIRQAFHNEGKSLRAIERETGRAFRTVKRMVEAEAPPSYELKKERPAAVLGPYKERIRELLAENKQLPRKQRWTAQKIFEEIQKEGFAGAAPTVRHFVGQVRKEMHQPAVYLPLEFDPGSDGQVDWGEGDVIMAGTQTTVQLFLMKLAYSRRTFMMAFPSQKQEAFFAGHVAAFAFCEGVPWRISYDNLKTAVREILRGRNRVEQEAFLHFRGHYLFNSHFCTPGAGHEKGQVEHSVGYYRRRFLVPLPEVADFAELNTLLLQKCLADDTRQVDRQTETIGAMWQAEKEALRPLPQHAFDCCRTREVVLNGYSQVTLETNRYSVPTRGSSKKLVAKLYPFQVKIYRPGEMEPLAVHPRCYDRQQDILDPLHYLPLLQRRPGALNHAKPIRQWRQSWPPVYEQLLAHLQQKWPEGRGVREFVAILHLHQDHAPQELAKAIELALSHHCAHADGVKLCLHQLQQPAADWSALDLSDHPHLAKVGHQALNVASYNRLLGGD